jgi:hypothetical protein
MDDGTRHSRTLMATRLTMTVKTTTVKATREEGEGDA